MSIEQSEMDASGSNIIENEEYYNEYLLARPISFHRMSTAPEVLKAVDFLCEEIGYTSSKRDKNKVHMRMLICDLYHNYKGCKARYLRVSMSKKDGNYTLVKRYNKLEINHHPLATCLLGLEHKGYVKRKKGYFNINFGDGYQTRIRVKSKLVKLLEDTFEINEEMISEHPSQELIIQRAEPEEKEITFKDREGKVKRYPVKVKELCEYRDNDHTNRWRSSLERYNALLARSYIDLDLWRYKHESKRIIRVDLSNKRVRRSFSHGCFVLGGRFYGGWWQRLPEALRERIIIDGQHVIEIDYSGIMVHILYAMKGLKLKSFNRLPYLIDKDNDPEQKREYIKKLMNAAVNANKVDGEIYAIISSVKKDKRRKKSERKFPEIYTDYIDLEKKLRVMLKEIKRYHSEIREFFTSDESAGLRTQFYDSQIAYKVINQMTKLDIPVLCVHDSFVCSVLYADQLREAMNHAFVEVLNQVSAKHAGKRDITLDDVATKESDLDARFPVYKRLERNSVLQLVNVVFSWNNAQYARQREFSANGRTSFNKTIEIA